MRRKGGGIHAGAIVCAVAVAAAGGPASTSGARAAGPGADTQREGRLATPPSLKCPRDNTTSFTGRVLAYSRGGGKVFIRVRTDEETTEQFTLRYGRRGPTTLFRLRGAAFAPADLKKIERRAGRLRPNMRATVWACYEGDKLSAELIDWSPPES